MGVETLTTFYHFFPQHKSTNQFAIYIALTKAEEHCTKIKMMTNRKRTNTIKVYPHTYMDRTNKDYYKSECMAILAHKTIMLYLNDKLGHASYEDISTDLNYELRLKNVDDDTLNEIKCLFPDISMYFSYYPSDYAV